MNELKSGCFFFGDIICGFFFFWLQRGEIVEEWKKRKVDFGFERRGKKALFLTWNVIYRSVEKGLFITTELKYC